MGELLLGLAYNRVSLRYKESLLGFSWVLLQPVGLTLIFTYIRRVANISSGEAPYPLFVATGLIAWSFTALAISQSSISVSSYHTVLKRIALPRILLPLSALIATLADLSVMIFLLIGLLIYYQFQLPWTALWVPLIFMVHLMLLLGLSCLLSLANVFMRDIGHGTPHILQLWFFASPVFYPASMVPSEFQALARWNPMTGIIEGYRSVLLMGQPPSPHFFVPAVLVAGFFLVLGLFFFSRAEGNLADFV